MIVYKCKMCNGNLDMQQGKRLVKCAYCDTYQSVPSVIDENKAEMVNRANRYRQNGEFDKATAIYEQILREDATDPEIHWSIVLCKFGVEYVEDPGTKVMKPTINRTQSHSIMHDPDYQNAIAIADLETKNYYMTEADKIEKIQRSIWRIAQDADDYDVFISYKELGPDGQRTRSSVLAQQLYERLTAAGIKTFYSRVSLAEKIGSEYEPYIFSALTSAEVMLVLGTNKDEFNAPWVKNEWSRFRKIANRDSRKRLIPCVQGMTIDNLPDELQPYQAQDMNKEGYEQIILDSVQKIIEKLKTKETLRGETDIEKLWKNGETFLYLKDYKRAEEIYAELCNREPGDHRGWWGRVQAVTKELSDTDALKAGYQNLKLWMSHLKKLAAPEIYAELTGKYVAYLEKASKQLAYEELENVKKIRAQDYDLAVKSNAELSTKLSKSATEANLEMQSNTLKQTFSNNATARNNLSQRQKSIHNAMLVLAITGGVFVLIGFIGLAIQSVGLFCLMTSIAMILWPIMIIQAGKEQTLKAQIVTIDDILNSAAMELDKVQRELTAYRQSEARRKEYLQNVIQKCNDVVANSNQYLTYKPDTISSLLFGMMCHDIGVDKPMDQKLFQIRQHVFQKVDG